MVQVKELMKPPTTISSSQLIGEAIKFFRHSKLRSICVVDNDGVLVGLLTLSNLFDALLGGKELQDSIEGCYIPKSKVVYFSQDKQFVTLTELKEWLLNTKVSETPVTDDDDRPVGVITQVCAINGLLTEINKLYNQTYSILKLIPTGIIVIDENNFIRVCNKHSEKLLKLDSLDVIGQDIGNVIPKINLHSDKPQKFKWNTSSILALSRPMSLEHIKGHIIVMYDTTEVERMAQEIESIKRLQVTLETVLNTAYEGLVVVNDEGKITLTNRPFEQLTKKNSKELLGQEASVILSQFDMISENKPDYAIENINGQSTVVSYSPFEGETGMSGGVLRIIYRQLGQLQDVMRELDKLKHSLNYYKDELHKVNGTQFTLDSIITRNKQMAEAKTISLKAAECLTNVLIYGESGTGKELYAHAIHNASSRCKEPFIKVNCAAIPSELAESEFFGYAPGAFTGAAKHGKPGKFELANGGTIFLDEIGDMPLNLQSKLLRVIQDREIEMVGGIKPKPIDVRIIAATNKDLRLLVQQKLFREDLYYRLNVIYLALPPLRSRKEDIELLVNSFLYKYSNLRTKNIKGVTPDVLEAFMHYSWPGNIRELENAIERSVILGMNEWLTCSDFSILEQVPNTTSDGPTETDSMPEPSSLEEVKLRKSLQHQEAEMIRWALKECAGNRVKAAKLLGVSRSTFYEKLKKHAF
jgi:transcriptional regulator with PAS, ATPase and Fis domain